MDIIINLIIVYRDIFTCAYFHKFNFLLNIFEKKITVLAKLWFHAQEICQSGLQRHYFCQWHCLHYSEGRQ